MEVAVGVVGWIATPVVEELIKFGIDLLKDQVGWKKAMKEKLKKLEVILPKIQAVVSFASSQIEISDKDLNKWLWQLRDAIDEADDVLDDFKYIKHQQQLTKNKKKKNVRSFISYPMKKLSGRRAFKTNLKRLEEVVNKLHQVSTRVDVFFKLLKKQEQEQEQEQLKLNQSRETGPLPPPNDIMIGRGNEKESVMQWLMSKPSNEEDQNKNISLLSIVGHGGMGKTTLLQHVYKDENITNEFPLKMWVCVSTNFDPKKVIADMLEHLTKERPHLETLVALQESLKSAVKFKKFLLVLDDIWEEENEEQNKIKWENVLAPLVSGCLGSKILITTRNESVASMMTKVIGKNSETRKIEGLEENECLELLNAHAFAGVDPDDHKRLRFIAREMVKKLSGSPLAAKIMGGILNSSLDESHWRTVLNSTIKSIMRILRLSYTFLPKHLQSCFAFCCIFPQDHEFDKDNLVRMWIALGFIQPHDTQGETMEDIGGRYFDDLVKKSFFDKFDYYYMMHDLLHDLAQSVSKQECLRVEYNQQLFSETPEAIRHLFLETKNQEQVKNIGKFKNLRSLFLESNFDNIDVFTEILKATTSIRLLYINASNLRITPQMPQAIRCLTHLRLLEVANTEISEWPTSLCNLYHLQFIIFGGYKPKFIFPANDMNNLSNLRYLQSPTRLFPSILEIGKLTSLQELNNFKIKDELGYGIEELEQMNDLRELHIHSLDNVKDAQVACNAKLRDKRNLTKLSLNWDHSRDPIGIDLNDEKVLDNLQPPSCLKKLMINKYKGSRSSIWMNTANFISNLKIIKLTGCSNWQTLPPFGQFRFLKSLHLDSMPEVKQLDNKFHGNDERPVFPSLEMPGDMFPCLTELHLSSCPNLQELSYLPPKLNKLFIYNIGWETLNCCSISKLEELNVSCCPNITNISLARLAAPRLLEIKNCPKLVSLGGHTEVETTENCQLILSCLGISDPSILLMEPLRSITSLQKLDIEHNDELVSLPIEAEQWFLKVSSALLELKFASLKSLQSLPSSLESLSSLKTLWMGSIPLLRELPNLPPSLVDLSIINVPQLRKLPNLPPSLDKLWLRNLDNLDCLPSCLPTLSPLKELSIWTLPQLRELPNLPPSLVELSITDVPQLRELPNLPPSLAELHLKNLDNLDCLPSCLPSLSSLNDLTIENIPQLRELPNLPPSITRLLIERVPQLRDLPDLPSSLVALEITKCHPNLMKRYQRDKGSDWHKIAHIPIVQLN